MPTYDRVIRNGLIVDGRNVPRYRADLGIKDGRIAAIERTIPSTQSAEVLDATGMIVAPGHVDLHTHYDAQLFWDPHCSISGWHGVTSVVIGNCGFGFAPARPEHREYLTDSLTRVEAIPRACLEETLPWTWETFPEWMDALDRQPKGVNVLTYVPLNPLLVYVMGYDAAKSRDATEQERKEAANLLREAMDAGACGWSAQRTAPGAGFDVQRDFDGTPFPTDLMSRETALALGEVLADYDHAFIQTMLVTADPEADLRHLEDLAAISNSSIIYNAVAANSREPEQHRAILRWIRHCREKGLKIWAQAQTTDAGATFTLENWNLWDESPPWREATLGTVEERLAKLSDPSRRQALKDNPPKIYHLDRLIILKTTSEKFAPCKSKRLDETAALLGYDNVTDCLLDLVIEDKLQTMFWTPQFNDEPKLQEEVVREPFSIWGMSDGGAHTKFVTQGAYPTESIIEYVREREWVTLEEAHFRLAAMPALAAGFRDRGTLVKGAPADIIVYDFENLRLLDNEVSTDLPGGEWRRTRRAEGYRYTLVNGEVTFIDGEPTGVTPGSLLRHGAG